MISVTMPRVLFGYGVLYGVCYTRRNPYRVRSIRMLYLRMLNPKLTSHPADKNTVHGHFSVAAPPPKALQLPPKMNRSTTKQAPRTPPETRESNEHYFMPASLQGLKFEAQLSFACGWGFLVSRKLFFELSVFRTLKAISSRIIFAPPT